MSYLSYPIGQAGPSTVVEVTLRGVESDVYLVDSSNFAAMQRGSSFNYTGGHYNASPIRLRVPHLGNWTAVVMPTGGSVQASVRTIQAA